MDSEQFDRIVARMATATDRRSAARGLAAALGGLGIAGLAFPVVAAEPTEPDPVETEKCGGKRDKCFRNHDCCSGLKCKGGDPDTGDVGSCNFKNGHGKKGDWCKKDSDCDNRFTCKRRRCR